MSNNNMNGKDFLLGAVVGGLLGALTALLLAPKAGKELRGDIAEGYQHVSAKTGEIAATVGTKAQELATQVGATATEVAGKVKESAEQLVTEVKTWRETKKEAAIASVAAVEEAAAAAEPAEGVYLGEAVAADREQDTEKKE